MPQLSKQDLGMPDRVQIQDETGQIRVYTLTIMKVLSRDESYRVEDLTNVPEDREVELVGTEEFIIAYVPEGQS